MNLFRVQRSDPDKQKRGPAARVFVQRQRVGSGDDLGRLQQRDGGDRREQNKCGGEAYDLGHFISLRCFVAFVFEMPAPRRMDARAGAFFRVVRNIFMQNRRRPATHKKSRGPLQSAASYLTVAGGFGGSGDDQGSLVQGRQRDGRDQREGGGEADKLGHCGLPIGVSCLSDLLMQPR